MSPLLYEPTERTIRYYRYKLTKKLKLSPSPELGTFLAGVLTGYIVLPLVLPIFGIKLYEWAIK